MDHSLQKRIGTAAFAFRGYDVNNLGKSPELLRHRAYGPVVERFLNEASEICAATIKRNVNLAGRVRRRAKSTLRSYAQDLSMIVGLELAQLKLLDEFFEVSFRSAQLAFGFSLGEPTALIAGGVYNAEDVLPPLLLLAKDTARLARDVRMGVLFSRGPALDLEAVQQLCLQITNRGHGMIAISTYLSPNTVLLLGQGRTVDRFKQTMHNVLPEPAHLRKNPHRWPPLHTPITWQKNIPNRAGLMLGTIPGGFTARILSEMGRLGQHVVHRLFEPVNRSALPQQQHGVG